MKLRKKLKKKVPLEEMWDNIQLIFGLVKDWSTGEYTEIPIGSIIVIIIGLLYFVSSNRFNSRLFTRRFN